MRNPNISDYTLPPYIANHISLTFELDHQQTIVTSEFQVRQNSDNPPTQLVLDGVNIELISIELNGAPLLPSQYQITSESLSIDVTGIEGSFSIKIKNRVEPNKNKEASGLYADGQLLLTQCETKGFRRITYFFDRHDVLATYRVTFIADKTRFPLVLSNGNVIENEELPDNKIKITYDDPIKKPSYLFALVAGNGLVCIEDHYKTLSGRQITLRVYVDAVNQGKCHAVLQSLKKAMRWDEENYGHEYGSPVYNIVAVNNFNPLGMENRGLNIFDARLVCITVPTTPDHRAILAGKVAAHECLHDFTGNWVFIKRISELALKEGLTTLRDSQWFESDLPPAIGRWMTVEKLRTLQFPEDASTFAHPVIPPINATRFFTPTIYKKGAEIFRMLELIIGKAHFRTGMDIYRTDYAERNATIEDFLRIMHEVSGFDLSHFQRWFFQSGTPRVIVTDCYFPFEQRYEIKIRQEIDQNPDQEIKIPLLIPIKMGLINSSGSALSFRSTPTSEHQLETVLLVGQEEQIFTFYGVSDQPIPSLLRDFSAPVKLYKAYSNEDLITLILHDPNLFNRLEAMRKFIIQHFLKLINQYSIDQAVLDQIIENECVNLFRAILQQPELNPWFRAILLDIPEAYQFFEDMSVIDIDTLAAVHSIFLKKIATSLQAEFLSLYHQYNARDNHAATEFENEGMSNRRLKNTCLRFLGYCATHAITEIARDQFYLCLSVNMTNTESALKVLFMNSDAFARQELIRSFTAQWKDDAFAMQYFYMTVASSTSFDPTEFIRELVRSDTFKTCRKRIYLILEAFKNNVIYFHQRSGEGYRLVCDIALSQDNPSLAAKIIKLMPKDISRFDERRQELMYDALQRVLTTANFPLKAREIAEKIIRTRSLTGRSTSPDILFQSTRNSEVMQQHNNGLTSMCSL